MNRIYGPFSPIFEVVNHHQFSSFLIGLIRKLPLSFQEIRSGLTDTQHEQIKH